MAASKDPWTIGRAPWYTNKGCKKPFFIGITGGTASGKTTVCNKIVEKLGLPWVCLLSMDRYYRGLTPQERANVANYNFDHPDAFDWEYLKKTLKELSEGRSVQVPIYDFATHSRLDKTDTLYGADVVVVEGIFVLYDAVVRSFYDMKVFVDTDSDLRLARRVKRDIVERGRDVENVLSQYVNTVKPSFDEFIAPTKRYADLIVPWSDMNSVAIELLVQHVGSQLVKRGVEFGMQSIQTTDVSKVMTVLPQNIHALPKTPALVAIHTKIRDDSSEPDELCFEVNRLTRLLMSEVSKYLPNQSYSVITPTHSTFHGCKIPQICGVSVVRAGDPMAAVLKDLFPETSIGKIVIKQTDTKAHGPRLYYCKLPESIKESAVVLLDAVVSTGNLAHMAIRVLLDHGVKEENIVFACIVAAPEGLHVLSQTFPKLHVVASYIEQGLDENLFVNPGLGSFGDRYYATTTPHHFNNSSNNNNGVLPHDETSS